jgi:hypothetical protein
MRGSRPADRRRCTNDARDFEHEFIDDRQWRNISLTSASDRDRRPIATHVTMRADGSFRLVFAVR